MHGGKGLWVFAAARTWTRRKKLCYGACCQISALSVLRCCCVLAAKKISRGAIKVTMVSHSPAVSAIESDWPAFKGRDYQQAGSKE